MEREDLRDLRDALDRNVSKLQDLLISLVRELATLKRDQELLRTQCDDHQDKLFEANGRSVTSRLFKLEEDMSKRTSTGVERKGWLRDLVLLLVGPMSFLIWQGIQVVLHKSLVP